MEGKSRDGPRRPTFSPHADAQCGRLTHRGRAVRYGRFMIHLLARLRRARQPDRTGDSSQPVRDGQSRRGPRTVLDHLGARLFVLLAVAILGVTLAYDVFRLQRERQAFLAQLKREAALVARAVEAPLQLWLHTGSGNELERLLADIRVAKDASCVGLYDRASRLVAGSHAEDEEPACTGTLSPPEPDEEVLSRWNPFGSFTLLVPLVRDGERLATLKLVLPSSHITEPIRRQRNVVIMERALTLAVLGIVLWLAIWLAITRPLRQLIRGIEDVGRGNLDTRARVRTRTEIGALAEAFNRMARRLHEAQEQGRAAEERRIALEQQLRHAEKLATIGQLASEVAHEVGTPLNVISGRARILSRELGGADPRAEHSDIIRTQVDRISRVIRRFLRLGRPAEMQRRPVALQTIVEEVAAFLAPELRRRDLRCAVSAPPDLPKVAADPDALSQVLLNLLMNAMAAVSAGGRIELDVRAAPSRGDQDGSRPGVQLCVQDTGHGIPKAVVPRVFEPFFSTKPGQGTGLGLTICRDIVREHGGAIDVESAVGLGTTVRVWLPCSDEKAA
jgi:signal transduction histidine kinase